jgi:hypothetical protein
MPVGCAAWSPSEPSSSARASAASPPQRPWRARTTWSWRPTARSAATARPSSATASCGTTRGTSSTSSTPRSRPGCVRACRARRSAPSKKRSYVAYGEGRNIDFPFQKNIHQLPQEEFIDCLHDLYFARAPRELLGPSAPRAQLPRDALRALRARHRREVLMVPYNEKLYATDLANARPRRHGPLLPARRPHRHRAQHAGSRQRQLQRDVHVPRGRRHRVRRRHRQRGASRARSRWRRR